MIPRRRPLPPTARGMRRFLLSAVAGTLLLTGLPAAASAQVEPRLGGRVSVEYEHARFDDSTDPWHLASLELSRRTNAGTVLLRGNLASRFERTGQQVEIDAYPRIAPRTYGYINVGYSPSAIFPEWRYGAEIFGSPLRSMELSAGIRHLEFSASDVTIFTGSAGLYRGNYYFMARPFVTPRDGGTSLSGFVQARRYFRDADEYVGVRIGAGATPAETFTEAELDRLDSFRAAVEGRRPVGPAHLKLSVGYDREQLTGDRERGRFTLGLGVSRRLP